MAARSLPFPHRDQSAIPKSSAVIETRFDKRVFYLLSIHFECISTHVTSRVRSRMNLDVLNYLEGTRRYDTF